MNSFLQGLGSLRSPRLFPSGLVWSLGIWAWNGVSFWLAFQAFGIEQGYATALFVQAVIALGVSIPSAPGYFGTFHGGGRGRSTRGVRRGRGGDARLRVRISPGRILSP